MAVIRPLRTRYKYKPITSQLKKKYGGQNLTSLLNPGIPFRSALSAHARGGQNRPIWCNCPPLANYLLSYILKTEKPGVFFTFLLNIFQGFIFESLRQTSWEHLYFIAVWGGGITLQIVRKLQ